MTKNIEYSYKCFNDYIQTGCPSHKMIISYHNTSDTIGLKILGHKDIRGEWVNDREEIFDRNELRALYHAFERLME